MKRIISFVLTFAMIFSMIPNNAFADTVGVQGRNGTVSSNRTFSGKQGVWNPFDPENLSIFEIDIFRGEEATFGHKVKKDDDVSSLNDENIEQTAPEDPASYRLEQGFSKISENFATRIPGNDDIVSGSSLWFVPGKLYDQAINATGSDFVYSYYNGNKRIMKWYSSREDDDKKGRTKNLGSMSIFNLYSNGDQNFYSTSAGQNSKQFVQNYPFYPFLVDFYKNGGTDEELAEHFDQIILKCNAEEIKKGEKNGIKLFI